MRMRTCREGQRRAAKARGRIDTIVGRAPPVRDPPPVRRRPRSYKRPCAEGLGDIERPCSWATRWGKVLALPHFRALLATLARSALPKKMYLGASGWLISNW